MQAHSQAYDLATLGPTWEERCGSRKYAVYTGEIEVSPNDDRTYRYLTLANGLRALLISDAKTDKAAAALGVQVGHLSDPDDLPGLAHFCEHMLFLGTEKFPDEAEYKTYLSRNSGSSNAYTSLAETVYHFDSSPAGLPGALARHAQFFTAPLFNASCTERELNAVDSEFRRNLQVDARRLFQLGKATSSRADGAVYGKFGTGSKESLWEEPRARGVDVRERLLAWYRAQYSANLMTLVVLSNHSLDELTSLVLDEYSDIPSANLDVAEFTAPPITSAEAQTEISYRTVKDVPQLRIEFGLPDMRAHWATKPGRFISHYVGHEGPGSILAELKARGWATGLSASSANGAAGFDFFRINVSLTAIGLQHYKDVLAVVFTYIELLKSTPPQQWAFEEMRRLGEVGWRWKEKGQPQSTARNLASQLGETLYTPEKLLVGPWFATQWDEALIKQTLDRLCIDNCRVFVGSKEPLEGRDFWQHKEKYYGTEYDVNPLELASVDPSINLALPERNVFVPDKLELVTEKAVAEPVMLPSLIRHTPRSRLFHKRDDMWIVPRGTAYVRMRSPIADDTARTAMLTQLVTSLVEERLAKLTYDAALAGLDYSLGTDAGGALLIVSGYTAKLPLLASIVIDKLKAFELDTKQYELVRDRLVRAYKNASLQNPSSLADAEIRRLTRSIYWTFDERLAALHAIKPEDVAQHAKELVSRLSIDSLVHGNFRAEDALDLLDTVEAKLGAAEVDAAEVDRHRALKLPAGTTTVYRPPVPSPENVNSAAAVYYEIGSAADPELLAKLSLFGQIAKVPVFSTLRTKEQLGYIVSSSAWVLNAYAGFRIIVQSERTGEYLDGRISALEVTLGEHLERMSEDDFVKEKESLALKKLEKPKSLGQESGRYWEEISTGELDFHHRERQAALIRQLTKADLVAFFDQYISPSSPLGTKLSVLLRSQRLQPAALEAFLSAVRQNAPDKADEASKLVADKPTLEQLATFVAALDGDGERRLGAELDKLRELPALPEGTRELQADAVEEFRRGLKRAEGYKPVMEDAHESARL